MQNFPLTHRDAKWITIIEKLSKVYGHVVGNANFTNNNSCQIDLIQLTNTNHKVCHLKVQIEVEMQKL